MAESGLSLGAKQLTRADDQIQKTEGDLDSMQKNVIVAPYSLAILGQVMLLATKSDFSLVSKPVPKGSKDVKIFGSRGDFKYITHPESFRATLVQVSNAGYRAFLAAHSNMDKIRLACGSVKQHVETICECVVEGDNNDVKTHVSVSLKSMGSTAKSCAVWSREIVEKFHTALELLEEVHSSCHASQMTNEEKIKELERRRLEVETQKAENERIQQRKKEETEKLEKQIEEERKAYDKEFVSRKHTISTEKQRLHVEEYELSMVKAEQERAEIELEATRNNRSWLKRLFRVETEEVKEALREEEISKQNTRATEITVTMEKGRINEKIRFQQEVLDKHTETFETDTKRNYEEKDKSLDAIEAFTEKISAAIIELNTKGAQKLDLDGIKKLLREGIEQVAELEKQWKMMVIFFERVANVVQVAMGGAIEDFSNLIDEAAKSESLSRFTKKKIIELAFNAYSSCNGVSSVATSYLKISTDYLMPSIVELGTLLALDSELDAEKIKQKSESIRLRCEGTVEYIGHVVRCAKLENANEVRTKAIELK